jgi:hypothetical protein
MPQRQGLTGERGDLRDHILGLQRTTTVPRSLKDALVLRFACQAPNFVLIGSARKQE